MREFGEMEDLYLIGKCKSNGDVTSPANNGEVKTGLREVTVLQV